MSLGTILIIILIIALLGGFTGLGGGPFYGMGYYGGGGLGLVLVIVLVLVLLGRINRPSADADLPACAQQAGAASIFPPWDRSGLLGVELAPAIRRDGIDHDCAGSRRNEVRAGGALLPVFGRALIF